MRSMLDHVQIPDLALREARRVLKPDGTVVIGLTVEGGKTGKLTTERRAKNLIRCGLALAGSQRFKDHHTFHPTYKNLVKMIGDNG